MGLTSIFKRQRDAGPGAAPVGGDPADAVQQARTRARQRLVGAIVLVGIGIVGFPLVFETQPRPVPVDIPIEVPRKDTAAPLTMPAAHPPAVDPGPSVPSPAIEPGKTSADGDAGDVITEPRDDTSRAVAATAPPEAPAATASSAAHAASRPSIAAAPAVVLPDRTVADNRLAGGSNDGARARALLEGKPSAAAVSSSASATAATAATSALAGASAEAPRYVVQVGAFADAAAARETRLKVEQLGMKTYTQVASTAAGNRIRVRVGPFGTRDEADKAFSKARAAGLSAVVLVL